MGAANGHGWGIHERKSAWVAAGNRAADWPGDLVIIRVPLHDWAKTMEFAERSTVWSDKAGDPDNPVTLAFGRFNWAMAELTAAEAAELAENGEIELTDDRADALLSDRAFGQRIAAILASRRA